MSCAIAKPIPGYAYRLVDVDDERSVGAAVGSLDGAEVKRSVGVEDGRLVGAKVLRPVGARVELPLLTVLPQYQGRLCQESLNQNGYG